MIKININMDADRFGNLVINAVVKNLISKLISLSDNDCKVVPVLSGDGISIKFIGDNADKKKLEVIKFIKDNL